MAGYTRQSEAGIVDGAAVSASDLNAEFNQLESAMDQGSGHSHDGTSGNGPKITNSGLAPNAVATATIQDNAVTTDKINDDAVTGAKIDSTTTVTAASFVGPLTGNVNADSATIDSLTITSGTAVTSIDTDLSSVSATDNTLASAKAIKTYVDAQVTASDLDFQGDSGGALSIDLDSETLTIAGGTGLTTTGSGNTLTVDIDSTVATLTGTQTLTNKTLSSPVITGNLTTDGDIDGRDIATDGAKLDGIEAGADVTDTANVTAAGALMDSEVTNLAQVKAFSSADYATAAQGTKADNALPKAGGTMTGDITFNSTQTFDGRDVSADGDKLDGIEAGADVTDSTNVQAAGALMDSEVTNLAQVKAFDSSDYATAAQGTLADSAVQPSDNISTLTNDSGFITGNQTITLSGDATGSGTTAISVALAANTVGVNELNLTDGTAGQFLKTDGAGNISFATAPTQQTSFTTLDVDNLNLDGNTVSATSGGIIFYTEGNGTFSLSAGDGGGFGNPNVVPTLYFKDRASAGSAGTLATIGQINFQAPDENDIDTIAGKIITKMDPASATDGSMQLAVARNGFEASSLGTGIFLDGSNATVRFDYANISFNSSAYGGIDFSVSPYTDGVGMDNELLDDYEEGAWTPNLSAASGTFTTMNVTGASCSYVKIGKQVTLQGAFNTSDVSIGTASGVLRITGIPFTPANNHARGSCYGSLLAGETPIHVSTDSSSNCLNLWYVSSATADPAQLQASDLTTGSGTNNVFRFTITYEV